MVKLPDSDSGTGFDRRSVLKGIGAGAIGAAGFAGTASAWGKGISWVAFCGCEVHEDFSGDGSNPEDWIWGICIEDGEIVGLSFKTSEDCTVYFKSGRTIYKVPPGDNVVDQSEGIPQEEVHPSASSDPCSCVPEKEDPRGRGGCTGNLDGPKFEVEESWKTSDDFIEVDECKSE